MANGILKFMIGHLGLASNVQLGLVDFKVFLISQLRLVLIGQQDLRPVSMANHNFKILLAT